MRAAVFPGLCDSGFHSIAQNVALEFGEHRQHAGEGPPARRRQVERLAQRDEADLQRCQFLQGGDEVDERRPQRSSRQTTMTSISRRRAARSNSSRRGRSSRRSRLPRPSKRSASPCVRLGAHGFELHGQRLLIVGRHPGVEGDPFGSTLAKNPSEIAFGSPGFPGFPRAVALWPKTIVYGRVRKAKTPWLLATSFPPNRAQRCLIRRPRRRRSCGITPFRRTILR